MSWEKPPENLMTKYFEQSAYYIEHFWWSILHILFDHIQKV